MSDENARQQQISEIETKLFFFPRRPYGRAFYIKTTLDFLSLTRHAVNGNAVILHERTHIRILYTRVVYRRNEWETERRRQMTNYRWQTSLSIRIARIYVYTSNYICAWHANTFRLCARSRVRRDTFCINVFAR